MFRQTNEPAVWIHVDGGGAQAMIGRVLAGPDRIMDQRLIRSLTRRPRKPEAGMDGIAPVAAVVRRRAGRRNFSPPDSVQISTRTLPFSAFAG